MRKLAHLDESRFSPFFIISISSIIQVFKYFGVYKKDLDPFNIILLYLYLQNHIIIEEIERIENEEDTNSI
jgi:hypothetical protein